MEQQTSTAASQAQKEYVIDLCKDLGLELPSKLDRLSKAEATAVIEQMADMRKQRAAQKKAAKAAPAAAPAAAPQQKGNGWSQGNYSPYRLGMCFKLAVDELIAAKKQPSLDDERLVDVTVKLYAASLKAEKEVARLHETGGASSPTTGGDEL